MEVIKEMVVAGLCNVRAAGRSPSDASLHNTQGVPKNTSLKFQVLDRYDHFWTAFGPLLVQSFLQPSKIVLIVQNGP